MKYLPGRRFIGAAILLITTALFSRADSELFISDGTLTETITETGLKPLSFNGLFDVWGLSIYASPFGIDFNATSDVASTLEFWYSADDDLPDVGPMGHYYYFAQGKTQAQEDSAYVTYPDEELGPRSPYDVYYPLSSGNGPGNPAQNPFYSNSTFFLNYENGYFAYSPPIESVTLVQWVINTKLHNGDTEGEIVGWTNLPDQASTAVLLSVGLSAVFVFFVRSRVSASNRIKSETV